MRYNTVIFDLDGTLLDTLSDLAAAANHALAAHNLPARTVDEVRRFVGNGIGLLIKRAVPAGSSPELTEAVHRSFTEYYKAHCADTTAPYPGIMELLQKLRSAGCRTAIVSNKADYAVQELAQNYFDGLLDAACGERAGIARKPAPDMVQAVMDMLQADADSTVYIGDSDVDIETARSAGLPCISITWGFRSRDFLQKHGASAFAADAGELAAILLR